MALYVIYFNNLCFRFAKFLHATSMECVSAFVFYVSAYVLGEKQSHNDEKKKTH